MSSDQNNSSNNPNQLFYGTPSSALAGTASSLQQQHHHHLQQQQEQQQPPSQHQQQQPYQQEIPGVVPYSHVQQYPGVSPGQPFAPGYTPNWILGMQIPQQQQQQQQHQHHHPSSTVGLPQIAGMSQQQQRVDQQPPPPPPPLGVFEGREAGQIFRLKVMQEPIRARMCGFGDKDRRPITPPPCVLLEVIDEHSMQPIDISDLNPSYFIMSVDLWSADGNSEVNLVRHSANSPSISATTASSYPPQPLPLNQYPFGGPHIQVMPGMPSQPGAYVQYGGQTSPHDPYAQQQQQQQQQQPPPPQQQQYAYADPNRTYYSNSSTPVTATHPYSAGPQNGSVSAAGGPPQMSPSAVPPQMYPLDPRSGPQGMFTRNLIGSLSVSAAKLTDTQDQMGIWFIFQDLSVRTEGNFRLKFSFVNVGKTVGNSSNGGPALNRNSAPVLGKCFSQPFQVFSAKKFPGVIESTSLSKCFASQGIKIPIRKDGNGRMNDDDD